MLNVQRNVQSGVVCEICVICGLVFKALHPQITQIIRALLTIEGLSRERRTQNIKLNAEQNSERFLLKFPLI